MSAESRAEHYLRHMWNFILAYAAVVIASTLIMTVIFVAWAKFGPALDELGNLLNGSLSLIMALIVGASFFAFPAMVVGYPIAVLVARRTSAHRTALYGAMLAPIFGTGAQAGFFTLVADGLHPAWASSALSLLPAQLAAGAAMGWTVSWRERRR